MKLEAHMRLGTFSRGIARLEGLAAMLGVARIECRPTNPAELHGIVGWGLKENTKRARAFAERHDLPYLNLEDGFVRSSGLGVDGAAPLSVVLDAVGIYYDATRPSALEQWLQGPPRGPDPLDDEVLLARAAAGLTRLRQAKISKYNHSTKVFRSRAGSQPRVLVVDQTAGDKSLTFGRLHPAGFEGMLDTALREHPTAEILVKRHPDVVAGRRRGCLPRLESSSRVHEIGGDYDPHTVLEAVDHVYVATSQLGFEALLRGKPVTCFGAPFYAGWGLTDDRVGHPRRGRTRTLEQLFAAAYLLYPRYLDPETGKRGTFEQLLDHLELQRRHHQQNARKFVCLGFSRWKRSFVRRFLASPDGEVHFASSARAARRVGLGSGCQLVVWGTKPIPGLKELIAETGSPPWRMEDGFLRSVGLGSDITVPSSLVLDTHGIYYDPRAPSDLESILAKGEFTSDELERAAALRQSIVHSRLSKYNASPDDGPRIDPPLGPRPGRRVILVPGQVDDDMSVILGSPEVRGNRALLQRVRAANPDAYVIYKPHPDVSSGNRKGHIDPRELSELCDQVVDDISVHRCLDAVDEVHTMTSLVGFEALLRGRAVVTHGGPFYAGWGLTRDHLEFPRRTRALSLDELVAGALIRYPRYIHAERKTFSTPEVIVEQLTRAREATSSRPRRRWNARQLRRLGSVLWRGLRAS